MFDIFRLKEVLVKYKETFVSKQWPDEKYKWEAVKCFQDNWDVNAPDFADMLTRSLAKTYNLLASMNNFPSKMIQGFARVAPEEVRAMYIGLFDESKDVVTRILEFKNQSSILLEKYGNGAGQHYQYENAVSTYLWLRYPEKYYIYKYGEVKTVADELGSDYRFKKGAYADNLRNFFALYDEIRAELKKDGGLVNLLKNQITDACYADAELCTLTIDIGFYISRTYTTGKPDTPAAEEWWPTDYTPALSVDDWIALLGDEEVFTTSGLEIMKRMRDYGGQATCKQLAVKYGESVNFYISGSAALAKRVAEKTGCPIMPRDEENSRWWPILYVGKNARKDEEGSYVWKLRTELSEALDKVDLSNVALYVQAAPGEEVHNYWFLNANPKIWSFSALAVGSVQSYTLYNENGNKRRIFQNFLDAKAGDMIIGYESTPVKQIVAIGRVSAEQDGEKIYFEKIEGLSSPIDFATLKECSELAKMEYFTMQQGSLFRLTKSDLKKEMLFFSAVDIIEPASIKWTTICFQRSNQSYRMLISLCQFILEGMLLTTDQGEYKMASFVDEQRMCRLYEKFILQYFSKEHPALSVRASQIPWALDDGIGTLLPVMQSDITLSHGDKVLIIDAKYYAHTTRVQYDKHTLHSNNLYQIFTYVKNKDFEFGDKPHEVSGMLLYAKTDEAIQPDNTYMMSGNRISVKTLDLNCDFSTIAAQLNTIADHLIAV